MSTRGFSTTMTVAVVLLAGIPGVAAAALPFDGPARIDAGVNGTWMPAYPVRNLDRAGGLDLAVIGCANNATPRPPAAPNLVACPAPQPTLSVLLGDGAGTLGVAQQLHAGSYPTDVTSGQFNNDRRLDLVVTDPFGPQATKAGEVLVYEQLEKPDDGDLFRLAKVITLAGPQPKGVQAADLNRDGAEDLVVLESNPTGPDIQVLLGDREGRFAFAPQPAFASCTSAHFFKGFSDFNEDGKLDFVVPCVGDGKLGLMLGNGDGTFTETYIPYAGLSMNVAQADLNKDGHADIAFSARPGNLGQVAVYLGDGKGNLGPAPGSPYSLGYSSPAQMTTFVDVADYGGPAGATPDGVLDVAVSNSHVNFTTSSVSFLYGTGGGRLLNAASDGSPFDLGAGTGFRTWGLVAADWNGDAKPDLAVAGGSPSTTGQLTMFMSRLPAAPLPPATPAAPAGSAPAPPPVTVDRLAPGVADYGMTNNPFAVGRRSGAAPKVRVGTKFSYALSESGTANIIIAQRRVGRRDGGRCVAATPPLRAAVACTRILPRVTLTRIGRQGTNSVAFSGRVGSKALSPGRYQATLTVTDAAMNRSTPKAIFFTIAGR